MAEHIRPVVEKVLEVLEARLPALCAAAGIEEPRQYGRQFTGVMENPPAVWVMPVRTEFDPDVQGIIQQAHTITITFGITGSERDDLTTLAMAYMTAIDTAIAASVAEGEWTALRVFVRMHDYGPLWERGGVLARFPEVDLIVETVEV